VAVTRRRPCDRSTNAEDIYASDFWCCTRTIVGSRFGDRGYAGVKRRRRMWQRGRWFQASAFKKQDGTTNVSYSRLGRRFGIHLLCNPNRANSSASAFSANISRPVDFLRRNDKDVRDWLHPEASADVVWKLRTSAFLWKAKEAACRQDLGDLPTLSKTSAFKLTTDRVPPRGIHPACGDASLQVVRTYHAGFA